MNRIKANRVFKLFSSVKLAIPLMVVVVCCVAYGTIIESQYNSDLAKLKIYASMWFQFLLCLLWLNILCAALSRYPWKKHHTGFLITHLGLLTLLGGAMITNLWGTDGQLIIQEKSQSSQVILHEPVVEVIDMKSNLVDSMTFDRSLAKRNADDLKNLNEHFGDRVSVIEYLPFISTEKTYRNPTSSQIHSVALNFRLKSAFFDLSEWLNSSNQNEMQLGPAHLKLFMEDGPAKAAIAKTTLSHGREESPVRPTKSSSGGADQLKVVKISTGEVLLETTVAALKKGPVSAGPIEIKLERIYEQAVVGANNKLGEGGEKGKNPALELTVSHQGKKEREVAFSKFPDFSMHKEGIFGLSFKYIRSGGGEGSSPKDLGGETKDSDPQMPKDSIHEGLASGQTGGGPPMMGGGPNGNTIEFHFNKNEPKKVHVRLVKAGLTQLESEVPEGESLQTPWMGIVLTLNKIIPNGEEGQEIKAIEPPQRTDLPPSAVFVKLAGGSIDEAFWLTEGDARNVVIRDRPYQIYYGRKTINLPFLVSLNKFSKVDYPGTETPMSFESLVQLNGQGTPIKISMNEPLVESGYTLYQSSYELKPGEPPVSIFSVNRDPGRPIKYVGSLILVVGIITFTLMRSRLARPKGVTA